MPTTKKSKGCKPDHGLGGVDRGIGHEMQPQQGEEPGEEAQKRGLAQARRDELALKMVWYQCAP